VCVFKKTCNNGVLFVFLLVQAGFQELHLHWCIIEMKEGQYACMWCFCVCFQWIVFPRQNILYILFPGSKLNGEWWGVLRRDPSTLQNHLVTDPLLISRSISLSFSVAGFHLTPPSPATCLSKPSQSSFYLSLCSSISPLTSFPTLILVMSSSTTTLQVRLIKTCPCKKENI